MKRDRSVRIHENSRFGYRSRNVLHHVWLNIQGETRRSIRRLLIDGWRSIRRSSKGNGLMLESRFGITVALAPSAKSLPCRSGRRTPRRSTATTSGRPRTGPSGTAGRSWVPATRCAGKPGHRGRDRHDGSRDRRHHAHFVTTTKRHFGERASWHLSRVISMSDSTRLQF